MIAFDEAELLARAYTITVPLPLVSPVQKGHVDVWISTTKGGPPARGALVRQLVAAGGVLPAFTVYGRDVLEAFPTGGRAWLVASYAGVVVGTGPVVLVR
jgi:hypothetical protein